MKKLIVLVVSLGVILFGVTTLASADIWTNTVDLDRWLSGVGTSSWEQPVTPDFQSPYDTLNSATLIIHAWLVEGNNDRVYVEGAYEGTLNNTALIFPTFYGFDIGNVFASWSSEDILNITLDYTERPVVLNWLILDSSTLTIDYTNGSAAAVPEPATLLLLSFGLVGVAGLRRRLDS